MERKERNGRKKKKKKREKMWKWSFQQKLWKGIRWHFCRARNFFLKTCYHRFLFVSTATATFPLATNLLSLLSAIKQRVLRSKLMVLCQVIRLHFRELSSFRVKAITFFWVTFLIFFKINYLSILVVRVLLKGFGTILKKLSNLFPTTDFVF